MKASDTILELCHTSELSLVQSPEWYHQLIEAVNDLLIHDFNALVQILYRLDVSEKKIRDSLESHAGQDAAKLITDLLLERQVQKIKTREMFSTQKPGEDDELHW